MQNRLIQKRIDNSSQYRKELLNYAKLFAKI